MKNFIEEYNTSLPTWGIAGEPIVDGNRFDLPRRWQSPTPKVVALTR